MATYTFHKKTIRDLNVRGTRVLLRADFNVPLDERGAIDSDFRLKASLPTVEYLIKQKAEVVILAHLGRPGGKQDKNLSLESVAQHLSKLLGEPVAFVDECVGDKPSAVLQRITPGKVTLLENVRFHPEEEWNDKTFAKKLIDSTRPDFIVQDGFGVAHRAHASTVGISQLKPAVAGLLLEKEVTSLTNAMKHPKKPLVAVLGGAKINDKLPLIEEFLDKADTILVGGALANTFLKFTGTDIGKSVYEKDEKEEVEHILKKAKPNQLVLPVDVGVGKELSKHARRSNSTLQYIEHNEYILDIGPVTADLFAEHITDASTVIWNGTLGYAENARFAKGSAELAQTISSHYPSLTSIIGGGDTVDFILEWQKHNKKAEFSHISSGGGASLELMSGAKLPGVEALLDA